MMTPTQAWKQRAARRLRKHHTIQFMLKWRAIRSLPIAINPSWKARKQNKSDHNCKNGKHWNSRPFEQQQRAKSIVPGGIRIFHCLLTWASSQWCRIDDVVTWAICNFALECGNRPVWTTVSSDLLLWRSQLCLYLCRAASGPKARVASHSLGIEASSCQGMWSRSIHPDSLLDQFVSSWNRSHSLALRWSSGSWRVQDCSVSILGRTSTISAAISSRGERDGCWSFAGIWIGVAHEGRRPRRLRALLATFYVARQQWCE